MFNYFEIKQYLIDLLKTLLKTSFLYVKNVMLFEHCIHF